MNHSTPVYYNYKDRVFRLLFQDKTRLLELYNAFEDACDGCLELTVRVLNINLGHNKRLLEKCSSLYGYAYFVATVRKHLENMELTEAVNTAVEECIRANILNEFLMEHKAEVVAMSIYEYNEEYVRKSLFEDGMETGYSKGYDSGLDSGQQIGDARRLIQMVESAMPNFENDLKKTCELLNISPEEYEKAKQLIIK